MHLSIHSETVMKNVCCRRKTFAIFLGAIVCAVFSAAAQLPEVKYIDRLGGERVPFVRIAQFQIDIPYIVDKGTQLPVIADAKAHAEKIEKCLATAELNGSQILVFPELSMAMAKKERSRLLKRLRRYAAEHEAIILAGTFYDNERHGRSVVIFPDTVYNGYKLRPSIFESSILKGMGMTPADTLFVFRTRYGNFLPLVCVDLISDDVNYTVRRLANIGDIDMLITLEYNPASREFIREASAIVMRHPVQVSLTNAAGSKADAGTSRDEAFGYSALTSSIQFDQKKLLTDGLPARFKNAQGEVLDGYENLLSVIEPGTEEALLYETNLRVSRVPRQTNAPDQGYPIVRNLQTVPLQ